jgi:hypothetical protein
MPRFLVTEVLLVLILCERSTEKSLVRTQASSFMHCQSGFLLLDTALGFCYDPSVGLRIEACLLKFNAFYAQGGWYFLSSYKVYIHDVYAFRGQQITT